MGFQGIADRRSTVFVLAALSIQIYCAATAYSKSYTFATFEGVPGTFPFAFQTVPLPGSNNWGLNVSMSGPITLQFTPATGLDTSDRIGSLSGFNDLSPRRLSPATLTNGRLDFDQKVEIDLFWVFNSATPDVVNHTVGFGSLYGDLTGTLGSRNAVYSGPWAIKGFEFFSFPDWWSGQTGDNASGFSFSLTSDTPFAVSADGYLNSFTADITSGMFAGDATPIPEPSFLGLVVVAPVVLTRRR